MNFSKDLCRFSVAAVAVAFASCDKGTPTRSKSLAASDVTVPSGEGIPAHCVPIDQGSGPVLLRGGKAKKGSGKKGSGGGAGAPTVAAVGLGAPPLQRGVGPDTADACAPASALLPGVPTGPNDPNVTRECFFSGADPTVQATVERVLESVNDTELIHVRLTFNPHFVDNSYGASAVGWGNSKKGTHTFGDLVGSDHAELLFTNGQGEVALHVKLDYISEDSSKPSGYASLGVLGGEGKVLAGQPEHVREVATSLDRNLNGCGYGGYLESSPVTDDAYSPAVSAPNWDYRVVYELWVAKEAFGATGFGGVSIEYVHASPSKVGNNTLIVDPGPCPPDGDPPPTTACPPGTVPRVPGTPPPGPVDAGTPPPGPVDAGTPPPGPVDAGTPPPGPVDAGTPQRDSGPDPRDAGVPPLI